MHLRLMPPVLAALAGALSACGGHRAPVPAVAPPAAIESEPAAGRHDPAPLDRAEALLADAKRWRERQRVLLVQMFALDEVLKDSSARRRLTRRGHWSRSERQRGPSPRTSPSWTIQAGSGQASSRHLARALRPTTERRRHAGW
jgi:hypothetical protein